MQRQIVAAVDEADPRTLLIDATAVAALPVTVLEQVYALEEELSSRNVEVWFAAMPPQTLATASKAPRWREFEEAGRIHPTSLAAVRAYLER